MRPLSIFRTLLLLISTAFLAVSCSNDNTSDPTSNIVTDNLKSGSWRITSFVDSGKDETNHFSGFTFSFENSGVLVANNNSSTFSGNWSITDNNSNDDNPGDLDFNIAFNLTNDFEDLYEDWQIVTQSDSRIELIHVSGGNGGTDTLVFEKI